MCSVSYEPSPFDAIIRLLYISILCDILVNACILQLRFWSWLGTQHGIIRRRVSFRDTYCSPSPTMKNYIRYLSLYLNSNLHFFLCLNTSFVFMNYKPRYCNVSYNRAFIVDWSLNGIMTSKLVVHAPESPRPPASLILISGMTSSLVIIPYFFELFP